MAEAPLTDRVAEIAALRARHGERTPVLVETTLLRRRAAAKGLGEPHWLYSDEALQQATAGPVARRRASRLGGRAVRDATCSIGTELAALAPVAGPLLGSDLDPVRLAIAAHNLGGAALLCRADALAPISRDTVVLVDPARRAGGRRRFDPSSYQPPLDAVLDVYAGRDLVVKCAPGIDFTALTDMGFTGEVELTSWGSSVREACLWSPGLAEAGVRRRASLLDRGETLTDADHDDCVVAPAGRFIVDPDGAVVRAGLVRQYATRHGLWQLDPNIAYLSGDTVPAGVRGFEVLDELPYSERRLKAALAGADCGPLEILIRGLDVDPDALRRRLRPRGSTPLTVVLTRIGAGPAARSTAFICRV